MQWKSRKGCFLFSKPSQGSAVSCSVYTMHIEHKCPALATRSLLSFFILSSTLLWGVEVWNNPTFLSHPKFLTSQRCRSVEKSDEVGIMSSLPPSHGPSVILYLVLHFSEVWKFGKFWQSKDNVTLFPWSRTLCHSLLRSTLLRGVEVWKRLTMSGQCRVFSLVTNPLPFFT